MKLEFADLEIHSSTHISEKVIGSYAYSLVSSEKQDKASRSYLDGVRGLRVRIPVKTFGFPLASAQH